MLGSDLRDRTLQRLGDTPGSSYTYYTPAEVLAVLNQLQRMFVLFTLCLETTANFQPDGSATYRMLQYFPDWIVPLRVRLATGAKLRPITLTELAALDSGWIG